MTSLWHNFSGNVVANSNWSCLLISASEVHWRVQPTAARRSCRFNNNHGTARIARVSQHLYETVRKCLERNSGHLITLQIWMTRIHQSGERRTKLFWNLRPKPKTVSGLKVALGQLTDCLGCVEWHSEHFFLYSKSVRTYDVCAILFSCDNLR